MWFGVLVVLTACGCARTDIPKHPRRNGNAEWGWHMRARGPGTVGHYYVKLPQSEQQVRYVADGSGYHGALAVTTSGDQHTTRSNFALGRRALELDEQILSQAYSSRIPNETQETSASSDLRVVQNPLEYFVLQTHFTAPTQSPVYQIIPDQLQNLVQYDPVQNIYYNQVPNSEYYNYHVQPNNNIQIPDQNNTNYMLINTHQNQDNFDTQNKQVHYKQDGPIEVIQVFKNHNCTKTDEVHENKNDVQESADKVDSSNDVSTVHGNFGDKESKPTYQGTVHYQDELHRTNARNERLYYWSLSASTTPRPVTFTEEEGISRLVASTQDLISNEDLLKINHAVETSVYPQTDDLIKPRPRYSVKLQNSINSQQNVPKSHVSISTKYGNIVNTKTQHTENERNQRSREYKFKSPIVVTDSNNENYKQTAVNNFISTMIPYIEDGYQLVGVKNSLDEDSQSSDEDLVKITPRPVSQNYLTPITVALRLLDANNTDVQDHEISESENIPNTAMPDKERTFVEIQQSIPIAITHINDVEYHREYMDEGRSNNMDRYNYAKAIYNQYRASQSSNKQTNQNFEYNDRTKNKDTHDNEQSGNAFSEILEYPKQESGKIHTQEGNGNEQIVQPIVIEKEVPVTRFIDRYIEKQVPCPEPVEVVKQVPVDRPVPYPVRYDNIIEKPVEVTRYVDKPYPVEVLKPYPVEVRVPYPVEQKVYVDRPVHVPYAVEKIVEKNVIHPVAVPTPIAVPVGIPVEQKVFYPIPVEKRVNIPVPVEKPVDRIIHKEVPVPYPVETRVPYPVPHEVQVPVPYPVERRIPVPVEKIVEKPVTKYIDRHIRVPVPRPVPYEVHVPKPYPVDKIIEKKVPYPVHVDRIVEKKVPYPVNTVVEKIVEKPVFVTKYVDKPYPVEKRVPYPVDRIVEKKVPYPVEIKVPYPVEQKPDIPYQFEKIDPTIYYGYGNGGYQNQYTNYIPLHKVSTLQQNQNYMQHQAESQRNYQIQKASDEYLKNLYKQNIPIQSTLWGNQYASSYTYNSTDKSYFPSNNYITNDQKYQGPPPTAAYNFTWEKNQEFDRRRTDRVPKNLRIEYGGFKPPLVPSTEVDIDGNPIKKVQ